METEQTRTHRTKRSRYVQIATASFAAIAIFGLGWATGSGKLQTQRYQAVSTNSDLPKDLDLSSIETVYESLRDNFDGELDQEKLLDGLKSGLAGAAGDPYTEYFNPEAAKEFQGQIDGTFEGIGAELGKNADDNIVIIAPLSGYPAEEAGLRAGDIVAEIDGESTAGLTISEAVDKIRGEKGTTVALTIIRDNSAQEISIVREQIDMPSVESEIKDGIGILTVSRYGDDTAALARKAAEEFKSANVRGVVLDLRNNPGGYLEAAVNLSSLWLDSGTTVLTERRDNVVIDTFKAKGDSPLKGIKTIVLINEGSASASEITAGALKDNGAATLIGQKSYGKGSVQQPINLGNGGLLKVTIARWFTPGGKNIDREGIEPDQKVELTEEDFKNDRDPQMDAALKSL